LNGFLGGYVFFYTVYFCVHVGRYILLERPIQDYIITCQGILLKKNKDAITTILQSHMIYHLFRLVA